MHLALVRYSLAGLGGAENTVAALARELLRQGHQVTLVTAVPPSGSTLAGVEQVRIPVWPGKSGRILGFALNCRRFFRQRRFEVIFSLERTLYQDVYRAGDGCHREWLQRRQVFDPWWVRLHLSLSPFHNLLLSLERRLLQDKRLKLVIANSHQVARELQRHYQVPAAKIKVIYNGVDRERFNPGRLAALRSEALRTLGLEDSVPYLLFLGSGFKRKGLECAIRALAHLKGKEALLLVVGQGKQAPYLQLAARLGVARQVRFFGPQPQPELFYAVSRVLVLPTLYDPCSNVVLEALAGGRPVITTAANGAAEFLLPGRNGAILNRPDDLEQLAAACDEFLVRAAEPEVQEAAVQAVADLSWPRTVSETLTAIFDLVK